MARIYTRTGDGGETSLGDGSRGPKSGDRVDLYGEVDELNSALGLCVVALAAADRAPADLAATLGAIQSRLFDLGAVLADPGRSRELAALPTDEQGFDAAPLEAAIDALDAPLPTLKNFILPGGTESAARLHLARTICRRVERRAVALGPADPVPGGAVVYLNRLSDLLFTAARAANHAAGRPDVPWTQGGS
jgi:cob(I)alamin adenosyltransferase